jgi:hypothetical protein
MHLSATQRNTKLIDSPIKANRTDKNANKNFSGVVVVVEMIIFTKSTYYQ